MQIGRKDVAWNFAATSIKIVSGIIVMPLSLHLLSNQDIGLWNIFLTIGALTALVDFGFANSFARNITYVFSGAKDLKTQGFVAVTEGDDSIDFGLLKGLIAAMRRYYGILALCFLLLFASIGSIYISVILKRYDGNYTPALIAWGIYGLIVAYQLFTYYYDALLTGRGYVKRAKQILITGQCVQIVVVVSCLLLGFGLISMVAGLFLNVIVSRTLSYFVFYDKQLRSNLSSTNVRSVKEIMKIVTPNSLKIGATTLGGFLVSKATGLIAPLFLSLSIIGSFGTTRQLVDLLGTVGGIWFTTYYPKMTHYRIKNNLAGIKQLYIKSSMWLLFVFVVGGTCLLLFGEPFFALIHSNTTLLGSYAIAALLFFSLLDVNSGFSTAILVSKNEVPFVKQFLIAGIAAQILLIAFLKYTSLGIWGLILASAIVQVAYQDWKWPREVYKELHIRLSDFIHFIKALIKDGFYMLKH
ncbi:MAG: hypothetical protein FWD66_09930 [Paludibacter sp.]|nr:hypothetical protein [Paludibacter sp.]